MSLRVADLFAGWGGFTLGAEQAGANVVWAANHWDLAVEAHAMNHPRAQHVCQDLNQANFYAVPDVDLVIAGPSCPGNSRAAQPARARSAEVRGRHDKLRSNAWAVVECVEAKRPQALIVENVVEFRRWRLYPVWSQALNLLGYALKEYVLTASHFGVPQRRDRLFVVGVRAQHSLDITFERTDEPGIGAAIDFDRGAWAAVVTAPIRVQERIAKARKRGLGERFLTQHVTGHPGVALDEPMRTITTKDQWAVVDGDRYRPLSVRENARGMGFPDSYVWPARSTRREQITGLGNAVAPPVARALTAAVQARL